MKFMYPQLRLMRLFILLAVSILVVSPDLSAQTKKKAPAKKTPTQSKDAKKASATASKKPTAKAQNKKTGKKDNSKTAAQKKNAPTRGKKITAAERRREEARRQAALAEQRRREQAAREARARKLAFERGLKNETTANIMNDNIEGEDLRVRQTAVNALGERAGTVVVMEAKTGKIVTMVNQEWAIKQGFKPCSTIKLVTGVAGLNEKLIDNDGGLANGSMQMNLDDALARSNNPYFQRVGAGLGSDKMIEYAKKLGLGQKTGINAEGESVGKLPYGNNNPRIYSHADDFEVTLLQLAVMVTAISNGGKRITPQFQRQRNEKASFRSSYKANVDLPENSRMGVIPGMIGAAEYGTARRGVDANMGVAGKTGSCIGRGSWVGLFASVAPIEDPKYAVVVITRGEGERGRIAAGIAGQIYQALSGDLKRDAEKLLALKNMRGRPLINTGNSVAMPSTVASVEEEEDDDDANSSDAALADAPQQRVIVAGASQQPAQKKAVVKTTDSRPVFQPVVINYSKDSANAGKSSAKATGNASKSVSASKPVNAAPKSNNVTKPVSSKPVVNNRKPVTNTKKAVSSTKPVVSKSKPEAKKPAAKSSAKAANTKSNNSKPSAAKPTNIKTKAEAKKKDNSKDKAKSNVKAAAKPQEKAATKKQANGATRQRVIKK